MKNALALVALLALAAVPALAEEGAVPQATLVSLGLGDLEDVSDAQGMQVRGHASFSFRIRGTSFAAVGLYNYDTSGQSVWTRVDNVDVQGTTTGTHHETASHGFSFGDSLTGLTFSSSFSVNVGGLGTLSFNP